MLLNHTKLHQKSLGNLVQFFSRNFLFVRCGIFHQNLSLKCFNLLFKNDIILICPKPMNKFLKELLNENALSIFFIFPPLFWVLNNISELCLESLCFLPMIINPKSNPSEPPLVALGITFPGYKSEDVEHIKALIEQGIVNIQAVHQIVIYQLLHQMRWYVWLE